jgi:hypothetical protein
MKCSKRSERRAQREKKLKKAKELFPYDDYYQRYADNLSYCGCMFCCNIRNSGAYKSNRTRSEYKKILELYEELDDLQEEGHSLPRIHRMKVRFKT